MKNLIDNKYFGKFVQVLQILLFVFLVLTMLFNRSFVGLYIFGFRLGELLTLVGLLVGIIFLSLPKNMDFQEAYKKVKFIKKFVQNNEKKALDILSSIKIEKNIWFGEIFYMYDIVV